MIADLQIEIAKRTNLIDLVSAGVELRRASASEWEGPCPICGGSDRLHVKATGFFCRQCHPEFGDAIEYVQWRDNVDFAEAVTRLAGPSAATTERRVQPAPKATERTQPANWTSKAMAVVTPAQGRIDEAESYLEGRGLSLLTAVVFGLGYRPDAPLPGTWDSKDRRYVVEPAPAVVIPWLRGGKVVAVRYRFTELHTYSDVDGKERTTKQSAVAGSEFGGVLYGGHVLPDFCTMPIDGNGKCAEQLRTLVLCEGELNAMSIYQVAEPWRWDVLSLGSETQKLTPAAIDFAGRYGRVIIWMDKASIGKGLIAHMGNAVAVNSPEVDGVALDANDLLQRGLLAGFLIDVRKRACRNDEERERVMWSTG